MISKNAKKVNKRKKNNAKPVRNRRKNNRPKRRVMPAAQVMSAPKQFNTIKTTGTSAVVTGCDLVYQIPDSISTEFQNTQVITVIPCNPAYWSGTRVAAVASGYQNYRPTRFEVIYVPQCAVTQQGNVIGGTLWNQAPNAENLQQTLKTSNGGMLTQCYSKQNAIVKLGSNLQYNLYRMGGAIDQESNPFVYIALGIATTDANNHRIVPGYFYVRYSFIFKNPIGTGITYSNSQLTTIQNKTSYLLNAVAYMCEAILTANGVKIPIGARVDIEYNNNAEKPGYIYMYNGTEIDMALLRTVWILENQPNTITVSLREADKHIINYVSRQNTGEEPSVEVPAHEAILTDFDVTPNQWTSYVNSNEWSVWVPVGEAENYYRIQDITQGFGDLEQVISAGVIKFLADKFHYTLKQVIAQKDNSDKEQKERLSITQDEKEEH